MAKLLPRARRRLPAGGQRGRGGQHDVRLRRRRPAVADLHLLARLQPDARGPLVHDRRRAARRLRRRHARAAPASATSRPSRRTSSSPAAGLGHGNTHAIVLAPATPQEMLDLTMLAFELAFEYRNPVIVLADGYLGQMTGQVRAARARSSSPGCRPGPSAGDAAHRGNLISSIHLARGGARGPQPAADREVRADRASASSAPSSSCCDDAEVLLVACNTPARMAKGAVQRAARARASRPASSGRRRSGRSRSALLLPLLARAAPAGRGRGERRAARGRAAARPEPRRGRTSRAVESLQRYGGVLPQRAGDRRRASCGEPPRGAQEVPA